MPAPLYVYATPTCITEALCLVIRVQPLKPETNYLYGTSMLVSVTMCLASLQWLPRPSWQIYNCFQCYVSKHNNGCTGYHVNVINNLGDRHTQTIDVYSYYLCRTDTDTDTHWCRESNSKKLDARRPLLSNRKFHISQIML